MALPQDLECLQLPSPRRVMAPKACNFLKRACEGEGPPLKDVRPAKASKINSMESVQVPCNHSHSQPPSSQEAAASQQGRDATPQFKMLDHCRWPDREVLRRLPDEEVQVCQCRYYPPQDPETAKQGKRKKNRLPARLGCKPDTCLNAQTFYICDPSLCPCGPYCSNLPFHMRRQPAFEVFLTQDRGWGLRAAERITEGSFLMEYTGEVISKTECKRRLLLSRASSQAHNYFMQLAPGLVIDARCEGNLARFVNSSCSPNSQLQTWHEASNNCPHVGLFALKDIAVGQEITYDYNFNNSPDLYACQCGSSECRGTLARARDLGRRLDIFWAGENLYYRGTVAGYNAKRRTHQVLYDDGEKLDEDLLAVEHHWLAAQASLRPGGLCRKEAQREMKLWLEERNKAGPHPDRLGNNTAAAGDKRRVSCLDRTDRPMEGAEANERIFLHQPAKRGAPAGVRGADSKKGRRRFRGWISSSDAPRHGSFKSPQVATGLEHVGRRIEAFVEREGLWFRGRVVQYSSRTKRHMVRFDSGSISGLDITSAPVRWLQASAAFLPAGQSESLEELCVEPKPAGAGATMSDEHKAVGPIVHTLPGQQTGGRCQETASSRPTEVQSGFAIAATTRHEDTTIVTGATASSSLQKTADPAAQPSQHKGVRSRPRSAADAAGPTEGQGRLQTTAMRHEDVSPALGLVGKRVEVFLEDEELWYRGRIAQFSSKTGQHVVRFDSGNIVSVTLSAARVRWPQARAAFLPAGIEEHDEDGPVKDMAASAVKEPHCETLRPLGGAGVGGSRSQVRSKGIGNGTEHAAGLEHIGKRIEVYLQHEEQWFRGRVAHLSSRTLQHMVRFDSGSIVGLDLRSARLRWVDPSASFLPTGQDDDDPSEDEERAEAVSNPPPPEPTFAPGQPRLSIKQAPDRVQPQPQPTPTPARAGGAEATPPSTCAKGALSPELCSCLESIGKRLEVYDGEEELWFRGRVTQYSKRTGQHMVRYDWGSIDALDLSAARVRWLQGSAVFLPAGQPDGPTEASPVNT